MISALLLPWAIAAPEGRWTGRTPVGGLRPAPTEVRLVHASLDLRLLSHDEVEVRADYILANPGDKAVVRVGVPITSGGQGGGRSSNAAASVRLLDPSGHFVPCLVRDAPTTTTLPVPSSVGANRVTGVCDADVVLPPGVSTLRLSYEGALLFEALPRPGGVPASARTLLYDLRGMEGWAGAPDQLDISLRLGPLAPEAQVVRPPGSSRQGALVSWSIGAPDPSALGILQVDLGGEAADAARTVAAMRRPALAEGGGDGAVPASMLDGDGATQGCATTVALGDADPGACVAAIHLSPGPEAVPALQPCDGDDDTPPQATGFTQPGALTLTLASPSRCVRAAPDKPLCAAELALTLAPCPASVDEQ